MKRADAETMELIELEGDEGFEKVPFCFWEEGTLVRELEWKTTACPVNG